MVLFLEQYKNIKSTFSFVDNVYIKIDWIDGVCKMCQYQNMLPKYLCYCTFNGHNQETEVPLSHIK